MPRSSSSARPVASASGPDGAEVMRAVCGRCGCPAIVSGEEGARLGARSYIVDTYCEVGTGLKRPEKARRCSVLTPCRSNAFRLDLTGPTVRRVTFNPQVVGSTPTRVIQASEGLRPAEQSRGRLAVYEIHRDCHSPLA